MKTHNLTSSSLDDTCTIKKAGILNGSLSMKKRWVILGASGQQEITILFFNYNSMFFAFDAKIFCWKSKEINNIYLVGSNKIFIGPYLNEKLVGPTKFLLIQQNIFLGVSNILKKKKKKKTLSNVT